MWIVGGWIVRVSPGADAGGYETVEGDEGEGRRREEKADVGHDINGSGEA